MVGEYSSSIRVLYSGGIEEREGEGDRALSPLLHSGPGRPSQYTSGITVRTFDLLSQIWHLKGST